MILRNRLQTLEQERVGKNLSTNSLFADYIPQTKAGSEYVFTPNQSSNSLFSDYVPQKSITPKTEVVPEKKSAFSGFGKAVLGAIPKSAIEYAAAGVDYLIKAGEDIRTGVTKQIPAMFKDIVYNKSDDPEIQKIINKYEELEKEADKLPFAQRQIEKAKLNIERARETTKYQHIGEVESSLGLGGQYRTQNTERYQKIIDKLSQYQDLENAGAGSQLVAGLIGSTPYTVGGAVPFGIGFLLNFGVQSQNNIRQKYDELKQKGGTLTSKDADNIYMYSTGASYLDAVVEQMTGFGVSKLYGAIFKNAGTLPVKTAFGYVVKELSKAGGGEALEEYISGLGQAVLAKITTDPDGTILTLTEEQGGLSSLEGLTKNAAGAFIIGSLMETVNTRSHLNTWNSTKAALNKIENKDFNELDTNDFNAVTTAIKEDSKDPDNMDSLELDLSEVIESTLESEGIIDSQVSEDQFVSMFSDYKPEAQAQTQPTMPIQAPKSVEEQVAPIQAVNIPTEQAKVAEPSVQPMAKQTKKQIDYSPTAKLTRVEWRSKLDEGYDENEGIVTKRVSDWDSSATSEGSGRDIVHLYWIEDKGVTKAYGIQSAAKKLGMREDALESEMAKERKRVESEATEKKTLVEQVNNRLTNVATFKPSLFEVAMSWKKNPIQLHEVAYIFEKEGKYTSVNKDWQGKYGIDILEMAKDKGFTQVKPKQSIKQENIPAKVAEKTQKSQEKVEKKEYVAEPIKKKETVAKKEPVVNKKDLLVKISNKQDVSKDIEAWLKTEEGIKETAGLETPEAIAMKIAELKTEFDKFIEGNMSKERLLNVNLQLLAYKSLADKLALAGKVKGHDISLYAAKILTAINETVSKKNAQKLIAQFSTYDLIHDVYSDKQALEELAVRKEQANRMPGGFFSDAMLLSRELESNQKVPTKGDVLYLTEAVKEMMESVEENPTAIANAEKLVKRLSKLATKGGQFIQAFSVIKNIIPEYRAEKILKSYQKVLDKDVDPEKIKELNTIIENLKDEIKKLRKESAQNIGKELDTAANKIKDARKKNKQTKTKKTAAELFAERIMNSIEEKEPKVKTGVETAVNNLYAKFKEVVPHKRTASEKQNKFALLAELVLNRDKYKEAWQQAREIIYLDETMNKKQGMTVENFDQIKNYFTEITDVSYIKNILKPAVIQTIANMDTTISQLAKNFFLTGEESISDFADAVKQEVAKSGVQMDDASFEILNNYLNRMFKKMITETHIKDIEKYAKSMNRYYKPKTYASEQEFIIDEVTKAAYYDVFADAESKMAQVWAKKLGIPYVTDEIKTIVYNAATEMARAKTDKEKDAIYDAMALQLSASIPSNMQEKATAWLRTAMLLNPTTLIRNMLSNILVTPAYRSADVIANFFMHRMKNMPTDAMIAGKSIKKYNPNDYIGKAVEEVSDDASIKRVQSQFAKYSLSQLFGMEKRIFKTKFLQTMTEIPYQLMSTGQYKNFKFKPLGDIYKFQQWYRDSMYNKLVAMGYNENLTETEKQDMIDKAKEEAAMKATMRTFRQTNILSAIIKAMQNEANRHGKYGKVANMGLKVLIPFVVTPTALTVEAYKFSPIALAKSLVVDYGFAKATGKWDTKDAKYKANVANKISQALVGTSFQFALGAVLSALGLLTGDIPEDEDERKQWESQGKKPYSIYIPGVGYFPIDWAQPISTGIMAGAKTYQTLMDADATAFEKASSFISAPLDVMYKSSVLQNISNVFGSDYGRSVNASSKLADFAQTGLFQAMPTLIKKLNRVIDPYERNVYSGNAVQVFFNRILQNVPGGTYFIPKKIDVWGNEIKQTTAKEPIATFERVALNLLMPFTYSKDKMDDVTKEVTRVFNETKDSKGSKALPSIASKTITRTKNNVKQTWELTPAQYIEYQQDIGKQSKAGVEKLINSFSYKNMSDDKKAEALADVYSKAVEDAGDRFIKKYPKTK